MEEIPKVLSIQSHTVHGYVGNRAAVFPLQLLGFEVDFINSVQFSNHTGYEVCNGQILDGNQLNDIILGLKANSLFSYTHLLTGYIGSSSFLNVIIDIVNELKNNNNNFLYICDPVLGDNGRLYVPQELVQLYIQNVVPIASIITPNQYECELLSDVKINTLDDAISACRVLHEKGPKIVVITSMEFDEYENSIVLLASRKLNHDDNNNKEYEVIKIIAPKFEGIYTGTGDLTTALIMAWSHKHNSNMLIALEKTIATMQAVIERTYQSGGGELCLIQSKLDIENPQITIRGEIVI